MIPAGFAETVIALGVEPLAGLAVSHEQPEPMATVKAKPEVVLDTETC